jgi:hypothetical protein
MCPRGLAAAAAFAIVAAYASSARADASGARWWVTTEGSACLHEREELEREIVLACGAVGGTCRVVRSVTEAELVATLRCPAKDVAWSLETTTSSGQYLATLDLGGPVEDRLRQAAMEVARDEAPERTLAATTLANSLSRGGVPERDVPAPKAQRERGRLDLTFAGTIGAGGGDGLAGGRTTLGLPLGLPSTFLLSLAGFSNFRDDTGARRAVRASIGLGAGAPFVPTDLLGIAFDLGFEGRQSYGAGRAPGIVASPYIELGGFARLAALLQIPGRGVRPYVGAHWAASTLFGFETGAEVGLLVPVLR